MGLLRRISSYFKQKTKEEERTEADQYFIQNGNELQTQLIAFSNGWYGIPLRSFTAKELVKATNNFTERVFYTGMGAMFKGYLEGRQILISKCRDPLIIYPPNHIGPIRCSARSEAIRDIVITTHMSHLKNVLKLIGYCLEFESPASVYEYAGGDMLLSDLLNSNKLIIPWRKRIKIASDIATIITYLHTAFLTPVIYRDLNPSNVTIDQNGVAKLFDFSLSVSLPPGELFVMEYTTRGTRDFMDSKYVMYGYVSQKTDVYSFGMLLLVLLARNARIFLDHEGQRWRLNDQVIDYVDNHHQYDQLIDPRILEMEKGFGSENQFEYLLDLALMCLRDKHDDRPDMIDVAKQLRLMEKGIFRPLPSTINS